MSTSEIFEENVSKCPCENGVIVKIMDSPDNPWSRVHISYEINCAQCKNEWQVRESYLINQSDHENWVNKRNEANHLKSELGNLASKILDNFVFSYGFNNFKEEHEFFFKKGICTEGPIKYKRFRTNGHLPSKHCTPTNNKDWLLEAASNQGLHDEILSLLTKIKIEEKNENTLLKSIKKFNF